MNRWKRIVEKYILVIFLACAINTLMLVIFWLLVMVGG